MTFAKRNPANERAYRSVRHWLLILKPKEHIVFNVPELGVKSQMAQDFVHRINQRRGIQYASRFNAKRTQLLVRRLPDAGGERG